MRLIEGRFFTFESMKILSPRSISSLPLGTIFTSLSSDVFFLILYTCPSYVNAFGRVRVTSALDVSTRILLSTPSVVFVLGFNTPEM